MNDNEQLTAAAWHAQHLATTTMPPHDNSLDAVWDASSEVLAKLSAAGYAPEEFLPEDDASPLHFTVAGAETARRFYRCYAREVRRSLCNADDELRRSIQTATTAGTVSLLTTLAGVLAVPTGAAIVLAPIAAVLLTKGIDAFCSMDPPTTSPPADNTPVVGPGR